MIAFDPDDLAFGDDIYAFARQHLGTELRRKVASELRPDKSESVAWQKTLCDNGWAAPAWPRDHGG